MTSPPHFIQYSDMREMNAWAAHQMDIAVVETIVKRTLNERLVVRNRLGGQPGKFDEDPHSTPAFPVPPAQAFNFETSRTETRLRWSEMAPSRSSCLSARCATSRTEPTIEAIS